jgi:hypothetical protein
MKKRVLSGVAVCACLWFAAHAQRRGNGGFGGYGGYGRGQYNEGYHTPREIPQHGAETPNWTNDAGFESDVFTFVRIKRERGYGSGGDWSTDTPDSDLNLSFRLQQVSSMKLDPNGLFMRLTETNLSRYPFIYMVEPGSLYLSDEEAAALRNYLLNGGFLMLDDFWGEHQWAAMEHELKKVFPDRGFVELELNHPLYHCVFDIKSKGQVPNVSLGTRSERTGVTWEYHDGEECKEVHHRAIYDDKGRMMVIATHNTDNGDGWEWEGDNHYYFEHFSEKIAYPLTMNIIFYQMTH